MTACLSDRRDAELMSLWAQLKLTPRGKASILGGLGGFQRSLDPGDAGLAEALRHVRRGRIAPVAATQALRPLSGTDRCCRLPVFGGRCCGAQSTAHKGE